MTGRAPASTPAAPDPTDRPQKGKQDPKTSRRAAILARLLLVSMALPLVLFGPGRLRGERFVSVLPVSVEPLRSEAPEAAQLADEHAHWVTGDRLFPFLTDQIAIREELQSGHLPTWDPHLGLGAPLFAGTLVAPLYPPNLLALLLPPEQAAGWLALTCLVLFGLGTGLFLRRLGLSSGAVACGIAAAELGGWGIANLGYPMKVDAAVWLPWMLWAAEGIVRARRGAGLALAGSSACAFLAGFVPIAVFASAFCGVWILARTLAMRARARVEPPPHQGHPGYGARPGAIEVRRGLAALGLLGLGLGLAAIQLLPTFETSRASERQSGGDLLPQSLPDAVLWGTLAPQLFGGPADTTPADGSPLAWWMTDPDEFEKAQLFNALEWNAFALASVVVLALVAVVATPRRALFPLVSLALVFAFAMGRAPVRWLYALPGFDLGAPGRVLALGWFLWPWLAALGVEALVTRRPRASVTLLVGGFTLAASAFILWAGLDPSAWTDGLERTLLERYGERFDQTLETIRARLPRARSMEQAAHLRRALAHPLGAGLACVLAAVFSALGSRGGSRASAGLGLALILFSAAAAPIASGSIPLATCAAAAAGLALLFGAIVLVGRRTRLAQGAFAWAPLLACIAAEGLLAHVQPTRGLPDAGGPTFPASASMQAVRAAAGTGRVLRLDDSATGFAELERLARPNLPAAYGVGDLSPYIVFVPRELFELVGALDPAMLARRHVARLADPQLLSHPILDLLDARAILATDPLEHPQLSPVLERPGFYVYHRTNGIVGGRDFGGARIVPELYLAENDEAVLQALAEGRGDLGAHAFVTAAEAQRAEPHDVEAPSFADAWKPGEIERLERPFRAALEAEIWGSSGGWLVMHEQWAPGWRARVNGDEVPVLRVDHALRAVPIPRGDSRVETWYAPRSHTFGLWISLASLLGVAIVSRLASGPRKRGAADDSIRPPATTEGEPST